MSEELQPEWPTNPNGETAKARRDAVGGWLLFFSVSCSILAPISLLRWVRPSALNFWSVTYIVVAIFMLLAGITTWMRARFAFTFISIALTMRVVFAAMQLNFAYELHSHAMKPDLVNQETWLAVGNTLGSLTWFWYFKVSSRVNRTFGRNL